MAVESNSVILKFFKIFLLGKVSNNDVRDRAKELDFTGCIERNDFQSHRIALYPIIMDA